MPKIQYSDDDIHAAAVRMGLIPKDSESLPRHLRSRAVAYLAAETTRPARQAVVPVAREIVVQPGGEIRVDGKPFPWVVQEDQIEVTLAPDGAGMVRLTIPAMNVQITKPVDESEPKP